MTFAISELSAVTEAQTRAERALRALTGLNAEKKLLVYLKMTGSDTGPWKIIATDQSPGKYGLAEASNLQVLWGLTKKAAEMARAIANDTGLAFSPDLTPASQN